MFRKDMRGGTVNPNIKFIAYGSYAMNLARGDTNDLTDLFVTRLPG